MAKYTLRSSKYNIWNGGKSLNGLIHELAIVSWTDAQVANCKVSDLEKEFPPFAVFPVHGDPVREELARKFAQALLNSLNAHIEKINALEVSI